MTQQPHYNLNKFIDQVKTLLEEEGIDLQTVSYADISGGAMQMLRGLGITGSLDLADVLDRTWPPKREAPE